MPRRNLLWIKIIRKSNAGGAKEPAQEEAAERKGTKPKWQINGHQKY